MFKKVHMLLNRYGMGSKSFEEAKLSKNKNNGDCEQEVIESLIKNQSEFRQVSKELCEKALIDAKNQLHPLLQQVDLEKLGQRREFVQAFKEALERAVAERIVLWLPCVKVVYKFDPPRGSGTEDWDNTIHLLLLVPRLLPSINELGLKLDSEMLQQLQSLSWTRFQHSISVVEIQQVTPNEIRRGIRYGAMFFSLYAAPVQVWPPS